MKNSELTPDQKFLFVEICERGPNHQFTPDLSEDSEELLLVEKLSSLGIVKVGRQANGNIYYAILTASGKPFLQDVRKWAEQEGRQGEIELELFKFLKENNGASPERLVGFEIRGGAITEDELFEAVDNLERAQTISIPRDTSNGGAHGLPLRASYNPSWNRKMSQRKPPAWYSREENKHMTNTYDQSITNNFSQVSHSQIAIGDNSIQNQSNTAGLSEEAINQIVDYFQEFKKQAEKDIADAEQRQALLDIAKKAEEEMKSAETTKDAESKFSRFLEISRDYVTKHGAEALALLLFKGMTMAMGLPSV